MFNLQGSEIIVILLIALVVLGPERLPDAVRKFMQTYTELKKMGTGFQSEIKSAFDEPMREMRDTANMVRDAADPSKLMAEAEAEQRAPRRRRTAAQHGVVDPGYDVVATPGSPPPVPPTATRARGITRDADSRRRRRSRRYRTTVATVDVGLTAPE